LVPVVNALIVGPGRGLGVDELLRCLYGFPVYTEQVRLQDRAWHSSPGHALVEIAFELGHPQVTTRSGKTIRLDTASVSLLRAQVERFAETFGRPPGPDNPLFFDPDADEPQPMRLPDLERHTVQMLEAVELSPAWIYAYQHTAGLLPRPDSGFASEHDRSEWEEAIARYLRLHPDTVVDRDAQTRKLQTALGILTLDMAARNPAYGASLAQRLQGPVTGGDDAEASRLRAYLRGGADALVATLRDDHAVATAAGEYARAWAGAALAARVASTAAGNPPISSTPDPAVLLAAAVAARTSR
jgi:hypothetical protein